jgi:myosin heavy subunit
VIGKETIQNPLNKEEAYTSRDAMAKVIYGKLFNWLVKRINVSISEKMKAKAG